MSGSKYSLGLCIRQYDVRAGGVVQMGIAILQHSMHRFSESVSRKKCAESGHHVINIAIQRVLGQFRWARLRARCRILSTVSSLSVTISFLSLPYCATVSCPVSKGTRARPREAIALSWL
jgi:hypothetical protein